MTSSKSRKNTLENIGIIYLFMKLASDFNMFTFEI